MRGFNIFEQAHVVNGVPPINATGGKASDVVTLKGHRAVNFLWKIGVSAAAATKILVYACDDFAGANPVAIPFKLYKEETAAGDTFDAAVDVTAAGYTPSANDNIMYGIYVDAQALASLGKACIYSQMINGTNSVIADCTVILTGGAAGAGTGETVIA
jgi:hypothetical protein